MNRIFRFGRLIALALAMSVVVAGQTPALSAVQNPQSGAVGLGGRVPGPPPTQAATITSPADGLHTSTSPITVRGTCPAGTIVFIYSNEVLTGQAPCVNGQFSLQSDLFAGTNALVARVVDLLGQFGPDSHTVNVAYDLPSNSGTLTGHLLFLETPATVVGGSPGTSISRSVIIVDGTAPYAISWDYGDGSSSLASVAAAGNVTSSHVYKSPGTYLVLVRVSDAAGNAAFVQIVTVVNGPVSGVTGSGQTKSTLPGKLVNIVPLLALGTVVVLSFWLGYRRGWRRRDKIAREAL